MLALTERFPRRQLNIQRAVNDQGENESAMFTTLDTMNFTSGPSNGRQTHESGASDTAGGSSGYRRGWRKDDLEAWEGWESEIGLDTYTVGFDYPSPTKDSEEGDVRESRRAGECERDEVIKMSVIGGEGSQQSPYSRPIIGEYSQLDPDP